MQIIFVGVKALVTRLYLADFMKYLYARIMHMLSSAEYCIRISNHELEILARTFGDIKTVKYMLNDPAPAPY